MKIKNKSPVDKIYNLPSIYVNVDTGEFYTKAGKQEYWKALQYQQQKNIELGYGNRDWIKKDYENSLKNIWKEKKN